MTPMNLVGQKFDRLTVTSFSHTDSFKHRYWNCLCQCGGETKAPTRSLRSGVKKSCGCLNREPRERSWSWKGHGEISLTLWNKILREAKRRLISAEITIQQAWSQYERQNGRCVYTGEELTFGKSKLGGDRTASLDRIDSKRGYVLDNIQWVHKDVNMMKQSYSHENFLSMVEKIYRNHFGHIV